jgi:uncharacterized protein (UPF0261 family)
MSSVYVVGTFDTKGDELRYVAGLISSAGAPVVTVDVGTRGEAGDADVPAREVAAHHPDGVAAVLTGDRGSAVAAMAVALERFTRARAGDISAMIGAPGQPFHDPEADHVLFGTLEREVRQTGSRRLVRRPEHINDPAFADALVSAFREIS